MTEMKPVTPVDQAALWNGPAGQAWVDSQMLLDEIFAPFAVRLADAVGAAGARRILDIGCGAGATALAAARRAGATGRVTGIDISRPMLQLAQARAEDEGLPAEFLCADAERYGFAANAFDMAISRFGVMFFGNSVGAFANIRGAMVSGGVLHAIAWRAPQENPFMTAAEQAAVPLLPAMPPRPPGGPGQFAFADSERVLGLLWDSGWSEIAIEPIDVECDFPASMLAAYVMRLGPLGIYLGQAGAEEREGIVAAVLPAFDRFIDGDCVRFTAACWAITARA